jgi:hypothetical protein
MPIHIKGPTIIKAAGNNPKIIEGFVGRVNSKTALFSIARMKSPSVTSTKYQVQSTKCRNSSVLGS